MTKNTVKKGYHPNGNLAYEIPYQNGELHGVVKAYDLNGKLRGEMSYQNDKIHGVEKHYSQNGKLHQEIPYLYGERVTKEEYREHELIKRLAKIR